MDVCRARRRDDSDVQESKSMPLHRFVLHREFRAPRASPSRKRVGYSPRVSRSAGKLKLVNENFFFFFFFFLLLTTSTASVRLDSELTGCVYNRFFGTVLCPLSLQWLPAARKANTSTRECGPRPPAVTLATIVQGASLPVLAWPQWVSVKFILGEFREVPSWTPTVDGNASCVRRERPSKGSRRLRAARTKICQITHNLHCGTMPCIRVDRASC